VYRTRVVLILLAATVGCKDARELSTDQVAAAVATRAGLADVQLRALGDHRYEGDGRDAAGAEFDVNAEVSRDSISWRIHERPRAVRRDKLNDVVAKHLGLTIEKLDEKGQNKYEGSATNQGGKRFVLVLDATVPEKVAGEATGPDGTPRTFELTIGSRASRSGQFTP
jgi:hypothetical protein